MSRKPVVRQKPSHAESRHDAEETKRPTPQLSSCEMKDPPAPAAGPHATEPLTNQDSTPGAGTLPNGATDDVEAGTG